MVSQACRKRARRTDRRLDQKHVPAAHGVLGGEVTAMPRGLDHVVHAVRDLEAAAELYRRLGFSVGARNQHSWGTHNHLVQLPGFFVELLTVAEPQKLGKRWPLGAVRHLQPSLSQAPAGTLAAHSRKRRR